MRWLRVVRAVSLVSACDAGPASLRPDRAGADSQQERPTGRKGTRTGDFDALLKHRMIRMLVAYSPTLFYHDRGQARGVIAAASRELKKFLNRKFPDKRPFTVVMIPTTRDRLLQGLIDGEGDVAGGSSRLHPPA